MRYLTRDWRRHRPALALMLALWAAFWAWIVVAGRRGADLDVAPALVHPLLLLAVGLVVGVGGSEPGPSPGEVRAPVAAGLAIGGLIVAVDTGVALVAIWQMVQASHGASPPFGHYVPQVLLWVVAAGLATTMCGVMLGATLAQIWREWAARAARRRFRIGAPAAPAAAQPPAKRN